MPANPQWIWIAAAVVAALVIIAIIASAVRRSRSARLRDTFGSEYDHLVREHGSRRRAEEELQARTAEAKDINIRPLSAADRDSFAREWTRIESHFVERPAMAVSEADELIDKILRAEGYPLGDYERHVAHLSVRHPRLAEHYREGHAVIRNHTPGATTTEELRRAMLHFRSLVDELLGPTDVAREVPVEREVAAPTTPRERDQARTPEDRWPTGNDR